MVSQWGNKHERNILQLDIDKFCVPHHATQNIFVSNSTCRQQLNHSLQQILRTATNTSKQHSGHRYVWNPIIFWRPTKVLSFPHKNCGSKTSWTAPLLPWRPWRRCRRFWVSMKWRAPDPALPQARKPKFEQKQVLKEKKATVLKEVVSIMYKYVWHETSVFFLLGSWHQLEPNEVWICVEMGWWYLTGKTGENGPLNELENELALSKSHRFRSTHMVDSQLLKPFELPGFCSWSWWLVSPSCQRDYCNRWLL